MKTRSFAITTGGLILSTISTGALLAATITYADESATSNVSVSVPVSCNFESATGTDSHTATINAGQYQTDIGETTFKIVCNDATGYAVYAIGNSGPDPDNVFGNTNLVATVSGSLNPTYDIATGTATSGDTSNWSMKLAPVAGPYAPTIESPFQAYAAIPSTYTKVATFAAATDEASGSSFTSTYAAYISNTMPAGTYTGRVRYTLVHPNDAPTPNAPVTTDPGKISYNPNAAGVIDTMSDQAINDTATEATLWASNFQRSGYGFAGWNTKYDMTGTNYGPNQTITFTAGQYSGEGLSLYASWVKSAGTMQNWQGCPALNPGAVTALTDTRDNQVYAVAKLADGKCWMIENLRLDNTPELTPANTDNPSLPLTNTWYTNSSTQTTLTTSNHLSATSNDWCISQDANCTNQSMLNTNNTATPQASMSTADGEVYSYGNYYNWYSATAGTGKYENSVNNQSVNGSICPAGWHLPSGGDNTNTANSDFWKLIVNGINNGTPPTNNSGSPFYSGTNVSNTLRSYPNNFIYSGFINHHSINTNKIQDRGEEGSYWSSTSENNGYAYYVDFYNDNLYPGTQFIYSSEAYSVRCIAGS